MTKTLVDTSEVVKAIKGIRPKDVSFSVEYDTCSDCIVLRTSHVLLTAEDLCGDYKHLLRERVMKILERLDLLDEYRNLLADTAGELWSPRV